MIRVGREPRSEGSAKSWPQQNKPNYLQSRHIHGILTISSCLLRSSDEGVQMNLPHYACFSIPCWRTSASRAPPALRRRHARATHARRVIGERTGRISAKLGERGASKVSPEFFPNWFLGTLVHVPLYCYVQLQCWLKFRWHPCLSSCQLVFQDIYQTHNTWIASKHQLFSIAYRIKSMPSVAQGNVKWKTYSKKVCTTWLGRYYAFFYSSSINEDDAKCYRHGKIAPRLTSSTFICLLSLRPVTTNTTKINRISQPPLCHPWV